MCKWYQAATEKLHAIKLKYGWMQSYKRLHQHLLLFISIIIEHCCRCLVLCVPLFLPFRTRQQHGFPFVELLLLRITVIGTAVLEQWDQRCDWLRITSPNPLIYNSLHQALLLFALLHIDEPKWQVHIAFVMCLCYSNRALRLLVWLRKNCKRKERQRLMVNRKSV